MDPIAWLIVGFVIGIIVTMTWLYFVCRPTNPTSLEDRRNKIKTIDSYFLED